MNYFLMFNEYVNILNKGDILIILVSGFSVFPYQKKYLLMRIFYVYEKHTFSNVQVMKKWVGENYHLMKWIRKKQTTVLILTVHRYMKRY